MAVTLEDMRQEALSETGDPDRKFFNNAELDRWINYAIQTFCRKTHLLKNKTDYSWTASTQEVAFSSLITESRPHIERALWQQGTTGKVPLIVDISEVWTREPGRHVTSNDREGTPERLYINIHEDKVGLHPTPGNDGTLILYYSYEPRNLVNAGNEIDSKLEKWWLGICQYAIYRGKKKDVDHFNPAEAQESLMQFDRTIGEAKLDLFKQAHTGLIIPFVRDYDAPS